MGMARFLVEAHVLGVDRSMSWRQRMGCIERDVVAPSASTIWRILKREGLIVSQPQKRPASSLIRFQAELPNEMWQTDITGQGVCSGREGGTDPPGGASAPSSSESSGCDAEAPLPRVG